ncbi:hypothetical protein [Luminiphilus syltensis]|uniref:hypothetical protein n=1 Tax=Luminiphilus syltensis TaxID=1341119 RepID=UPI0012B5991E|nr:hypothetical protein [Luminiphilus syltensis]
MVDAVLLEVNPYRDRAKYRRHIELFLLCLSCSALFNRFLHVSLNKSLYSPSGASINPKASFALRIHTLSFDVVSRLVAVFERLGLVDVRKGFHDRSGGGGSRPTRLFPTKEFFPVILPYSVYTEEPFEAPFVIARGASNDWEGAIHSHPDDIDKLSFINDFLVDHDWACKGPIRRIYGATPFGSGRLYTPFQGIPARRAPVRINTLIDGHPLAEVDFSASQLRLALAVEGDIDAGDDPYADVASMAGLSRDKVKSFFTVSFGASSKKEGSSALYGSRLKDKEIDACHDAALDLWPDLDGWLFTDAGVKLQSLEGSILLDVIYEGAKKGIVVLPIHDAIAVKQSDVLWAEDAMERFWLDHATGSLGKGVAKPRLKVDMP